MKSDGLRCILCRRQVAVLRHQKQLKTRLKRISGAANNITTWNNQRRSPPFYSETNNKINVELLTEENNSSNSNNNTTAQSTGTINFIFSTKIWPWNWSM